MKSLLALLLLLVSLAPMTSRGGENPFPGDNESQWISIRANGKEARTKAVELGMSIETVVNDMSYGFAPMSIVQKLQKNGVDVVTYFPASVIRNHDFPGKDSVFHDYKRMEAAMDDLAAKFPNLVKKFTIGKTLEGRDIVGVRINSHAKNATELTGQPGIVFMGGHHAREHLSVEMPIMYAQHLVSNYGKDPTVTSLIDNRDIYFIPMVNADGAEFDISTGNYQMWRKNRRPNQGNKCDGVDINRNYGYRWGTGGSSTDPCSDVYMGASAFSEPETRAVKAFVESRPNVKILLTFHTYSELILYPWGSSYDPITKSDDLAAYKTMADTMARWNGYTAEQSSELYITSGDTTDWSYGQLGIFSFTFELSPRDSWGGGGFYPGAEAIQKTFDANMRPVLYLIDLADEPHRAHSAPQTTLFYGK